MDQHPSSVLAGPVVEEEIHLTLIELCRVCRVPEEQVRDWVGEGVLEPIGASPPEWRFAGAALRRTRLAHPAGARPRSQHLGHRAGARPARRDRGAARAAAAGGGRRSLATRGSDQRARTRRSAIFFGARSVASQARRSRSRADRPPPTRPCARVTASPYAHAATAGSPASPCAEMDRSLRRWPCAPARSA